MAIHLRYTVGSDEASDFDGLQATVEELLDELGLDWCRNSWRWDILEPIACGDFDNPGVSPGQDVC